MLGTCGDMLLLSSLFATPLALLLISFSLGIALHTATNASSHHAALTMSARFFGMSYYFQLAVPFFFLSFLLLAHVRGFGVLTAGSQLAVTAASHR